MIFRVGSVDFRVRVQAAPVTDDQGRAIDGLCDPEGCEIILSAALRGQMRAHVLAHELRHAWAFVLGRTRDQEQDASFAAMFARWFNQGLVEQGGEAALDAMRPCDDPEPRMIAVGDSQIDDRWDGADEVRYVPAEQIHEEQLDARARRDRCMCFCGVIIAGGSIVSEKPIMDEAYGAARFGGLTVRRWAYCPHCNHLMAWVEGCTPAGTPNGDIAAPVRFVKGPAVDEFLEKHPEAAGLVTA